MEKPKINFEKILKIENIFIIFIIILGLLLRIPREPEIVGADTFEILWMAKAIAYGDGATWIINIFSFFGFFPFSFYPVGMPAIIALLLLIFGNERLVAFLISSTFFIIGSIGAFKFGKFLTKNKFYQMIFIVGYAFVPLFYRFTYNTLNARAPIMAFSIWVYYFVYKFWKTEKKRNLLYSAILIFIMMFFHRLWIIFFLVYISLGIAIIIKKSEKINNLFRENTVIKVAFFILNLLLMIASYYIFGVDQNKIVTPWFSNENVFGLFINLIIDYGLRLGPIMLFAAIEIYYLFIDNEKEEENEYFLLEKIIICFVALTWTYTKYNTIIFLPFLLVLAIKGMKQIDEKHDNKKFIAFISFSFLISFAYNELIVKNIFFSILIFVIFLGAFAFELIKNYLIEKGMKVERKVINGFFISTLASIIIFSVISNIGLLSTELEKFPYYYITEEEKEVAEFLILDGIKGAVFVSSNVIADHISSYNLIKTIPGGTRSATQLYYNWITEEEVKENTRFNFQYFIKNLVFEYTQSWPETEILEEIKLLSPLTDEGIQNLTKLGLQYAICLKTLDGNIDYNSTEKIYHNFYSKLIFMPIAYETEHLFVWKLYS